MEGGRRRRGGSFIGQDGILTGEQYERAMDSSALEDNISVQGDSVTRVSTSRHFDPTLLEPEDSGNSEHQSAIACHAAAGESDMSSDLAGKSFGTGSKRNGSNPNTLLEVDKEDCVMGSAFSPSQSSGHSNIEHEEDGSEYGGTTVSMSRDFE